MFHVLYRKMRYLFLPILFVLVMTACSTFGVSATSPSSSSTAHKAVTTRQGGTSTTTTGNTTDSIVEQVLTNMHLHAWNAQAMIKSKTTGGLYINWQMDNPSITNATKAGRGSATASLHDPQVDLLYLTALIEYRQLHPDSHVYDADLNHATTMVLTDFAHYSLPKGWVYFYVLNDALALNNSQMQNEAQAIAKNIYTDWYDPTLGFIYERKHKPADYATNDIMQSGSALIDAGQRWNQPAWVTAGEKTLDHVVSAAYNTQYNMMYTGMYASSNGQDKPQNDQAKPSTQGEVATALMTAYELTNNQHYLNVAGQLLHGLFASGLWDSSRGGFYFALKLSSGKLITSYKETRSQSLVLIALHQYDLLSGNSMASQEQEVLATLASNFYQSTYHGFVYRLTPDFHIYVSKAGDGIGVENFFTTEAMGSSLDALQQAEMGIAGMKK